MARRPQKKPPQRVFKSDPILHTKPSLAAQQIDMMCGGLERMKQHMDWTWGINRLEELVSAETAAKYARAVDELYAGYAVDDVGAVSKWVEVCKRGLAAMDAEARSSGHLVKSAEYWEIEADGVKYALLRDSRMWQQLAHDRPELTLVTEREMVFALQAYRRSFVGEVMAAAKDAFGEGVQMAERRQQPVDDNLDGEIPFGQLIED